MVANDFHKEVLAGAEIRKADGSVHPDKADFVISL